MITDQDYELKFEFLTEDKLPEAADLMTDAFLTRNDIWKELKVPREDAEKVMKARVLKFYQGNLSVVLFYLIQMMVDPGTRELAMIGTAMDLTDYLKPDPNPLVLGPWQARIKKIAHELEHDFFQSLNPKKGEYIYADIGAVKKKFISKNGSFTLWGVGFGIYGLLGFKYMFGRASSPVTVKILERIGVKVIKRVYL